MKCRIVFAGTPEFGLDCLKALCEAHEVVAVYTQPDRPSGRGQKLTPSAIKTFALTHDIPVFQPENFKNPETIQSLADLKPDIMVVIAYGLILPKKVLAIPTLGCINVHASILPRWRGAAPIQYAILNQDKETGVAIMQMDAGMDTGPYYEIATCSIESTDTAQTLHDKLAKLSVNPLLNTLSQLGRAGYLPQIQSEMGVTYAPKIDKSMAKIDWSKSVFEIDAMIRAFYPWPIAYTEIDNERVRIHQAHILECTHQAIPGTLLSIDKKGLVVATSQGALSIQSLQFPGGKILSVVDWLNAPKQKLSVGMVL